MKTAHVLVATVLAAAIMSGVSAEALKAGRKEGAIVGQLRKLTQDLTENIPVKDVVINLDPRYTYENIVDPATGRSFVRVTDTNMEDEELEKTPLGKFWELVSKILVGGFAGAGVATEELISNLRE